MQINSKYTISPDAELAFQGSIAKWQSKVDGHNKFGFFKQTHRLSNVMCDCYLSRVLNTADKIDGLPAVKRTPKTKIVGGEVDKDSNLILQTVSRVQGLEGVEHADTVNYHSLFSFNRSTEVGHSISLEGVFGAVVDAVLIQRWDVKLENMSAPFVRSFDMEYALSHASPPRQKSWTQEEFNSLVNGTSDELNIIPDKFKEESAIAYAFVQVIAPLGTRVTDFYHRQSSKYVSISKENFQPLFEAVREDIKSLRRSNETPTETVLRAFAHRSDQLRQAMQSTEKNPKIEVIKELNRIEFPTGGRHRVDNFEQRLEASLNKFDGFIKRAQETFTEQIPAHHNRSERTQLYSIHPKSGHRFSDKCMEQ